jgi:carboxymethylenebutenolidase
MNEYSLEIRTPDGAADAVLYHPQGGGPWAGVIHLTDIGGIRTSHGQMAQRLASLGYVVLMPNIFYRTGRPPLFATPFKAGDEASMKRLRELSEPLTAEAMQRDGAAYVDFLGAQDSVRKGGIGIVGYCLTGRMAIYAAAVRPEAVAAAASFHGAGLCTDSPASPHLLLPQVRARLYFGHATNDRGMDAAAIEKFNRALAAWGGKYESEVYEGALHSWTVPDSPVYNPEQAERAFGKLKELFAETL